MSSYGVMRWSRWGDVHPVHDVRGEGWLVAGGGEG